MRRLTIYKLVAIATLAIALLSFGFTGNVIADSRHHGHHFDNHHFGHHDHFRHHDNAFFFSFNFGRPYYYARPYNYGYPVYYGRPYYYPYGSYCPQPYYGYRY